MPPTPASFTLFVHLNQIRTESARDDLEAFRTSYELVDRPLAEATKEDVAESAQISAMNVAHCQLKYGVLPLTNFSRMLRADRMGPETVKLLWAGMQKLVGSLGQVLGLADDDVPDEIH